MPVEMLISCLFPDPGWQSRLIDTEMLVSFVLRSSVAVLAAILSAGLLGKGVVGVCASTRRCENV